MMEQYLDGPEVDVDLVLNSEGEVSFGNVTDNWPTIEPYFNETGSNCPSILSLQQQRELCQLSVAAVKCMGFTVGVFHVECKYTSKNGPQLIEVCSKTCCTLTHVYEVQMPYDWCPYFIACSLQPLHPSA